MANNNSQRNQPSDNQAKAFHPLGAIFQTSSSELPYVGVADKELLDRLGIVPPEGKEWKIFLKQKVSKQGKHYLSAYLGLSDIRR
jgi:hypothetical protein